MNKLVLSLGACLMGAVALGVENPLPKWAFGGFERPAGVNPVIKPNAATKFPCPMQKRPIKWEESDTFNPAATIKDGKIHVLYRAEDNTHQGVGSRTSRIGLAVSKDGVTMAREPKPVLFPGGDDQKKFDCPGGCEDPRVAVTEDGLYVMTYTSWNRQCPRLCIATSRDLRHWTKHGPAFAKAQNGRFLNMGCKSGAIVTEPSAKDPSRYVIAKIHGKYLMYWGEAAIDAASKAELPLFCYEDEDKLFLKTPIESRGEIKTASVVTGPEGGFEPAEAEYAKSRGMMSVTMGPRILRCETAPMCALAAVMYSTNNL